MKSTSRIFKMLLSLEGPECFECALQGRCPGEGSAAPTLRASPSVDKQSATLTDVFPLIRTRLCPVGPLANVGVPLGKPEPGFTFSVPKHFLIRQQSLRFFSYLFVPCLNHPRELEEVTVHLRREEFGWWWRGCLPLGFPFVLVHHWEPLWWNYIFLIHLKVHI